MSGGLGWIIDKDMDNKSKIIYYNARITSFEFVIDERPVVIMGVYMPCNSVKEYKKALADLDKILDHNLKNKRVIIIGDFNVDLIRAEGMPSYNKVDDLYENGKKKITNRHTIKKMDRKK